MEGQQPDNIQSVQDLQGIPNTPQNILQKIPPISEVEMKNSEEVKENKDMEMAQVNNENEEGTKKKYSVLKKKYKALRTVS